MRATVLGALLLAVVGCESSRSSSSGDQAQPAREEANTTAAQASNMPPQTCTIQGIRLSVPVPEGYQLDLQGDDVCRIYSGTPEQSPLLFQIFAVSVRDAGPEQILNEEGDAARRWFLAIGIMGQAARPAGEGTTTVAGRQESYYRIVGQPRGLEGPRDALVLRLRQGDFNLVFGAIMRPGDSALQQTVLSMLSGITLSS